MSDNRSTQPPMAMASRPSSLNKTGSWRFERPVFVRQIAPCHEACPAGVDIPAAMALAAKGDLEAASRLILGENPFPEICGQICARPCERVCNRRRFDEAVSIGDLEKSISEVAEDDGLLAPMNETAETRRVAVLGSGLATFAAAYFLRLLQHEVTIFDTKQRTDFFQLADAHPTLSKDDLERAVQRVLRLGVELRDDDLPVTAGGGEFTSQFDAVLVPTSSPSELEGIHGFISEVHPHTSVVVPAGVKRSIEVKVYRPPVDSDHPMVLIHQLSPSKARKLSGYSRTVARDIGVAKLMAMAFDLTLHAKDQNTLHSFAVGKLGAISMQHYLSGSGIETESHTDHTLRFGDLNPAYFKKAPRTAPTTPDGVFKKDQAILAAGRCFNCGLCTYCNQCNLFCPDLAVTIDSEREQRAIDYDYCKGCGICAEECPRGAITWQKE